MYLKRVLKPNKLCVSIINISHHPIHGKILLLMLILVGFYGMYLKNGRNLLQKGTSFSNTPKKIVILKSNHVPPALSFSHKNDKLSQTDEVDEIGFAKRLPSAIIIGAKKCGTTALRHYLNEHPYVVGTRVEAHYFDDPRRVAVGIEIYRQLLPESLPFQLTIEGSPSYFITSKAPELIYAMNSSIKLILMVREPVQRAISDYAHSLHYKEDVSGLSFEDEVIDRLTGQVNASSLLISRSLYHLHLQRWFDVFPRDQILILGCEDFMSSPAAQMQKVETFIGVSHYLDDSKFMRHESQKFYCLKLTGTDKCMPHMASPKHPNVNPEVVIQLKKYFKSHNEELFKLIDETFDWTQ